jgi:hypothetical protein
MPRRSRRLRRAVAGAVAVTALAAPAAGALPCEVVCGSTTPSPTTAPAPTVTRTTDTKAASDGFGDLVTKAVDQVEGTQAKADDLADRVRRAAPACKVEAGAAVDPADFDLVINATSLGQNGQGPLPLDVSRVSATALVADAVGVPEYTPLLQAAQARGLGIVRGSEMLMPQIETGADFLGMTV